MIFSDEFFNSQVPEQDDDPVVIEDDLETLVEQPEQDGDLVLEGDPETLVVECDAADDQGNVQFLVSSDDTYMTFLKF